MKLNRRFTLVKYWSKWLKLQSESCIGLAEFEAKPAWLKAGAGLQFLTARTRGPTEG